MEIRAYNEEYLPLAQRVMGDLFDFAINTLELDEADFTSMFMSSDVAKQISIGNPAYVAGRNGCELSRLVLEQAGAVCPDHPDVMYPDKSPEYWAGWALAYYQWLRDMPFDKLFRIVPFREILNMYNIYHEMDIERFVEEIDRKILARQAETRLQFYRKQIGLSQSELSRRSGVPLRQIQLFEQRQRSISRAQAATLLQLSKALYCSMEDLLER